MATKKTEAVAIRPVNTEQARKRAAWVLSYHDGTRIGANMTIMNAIACGIQLNKAKEELPHGEFMKWHRKYLKTIGDRSTRNYMSLVLNLKALHPGKMATVANLLDVDPSKVSPEYTRKLMPKVQNLIEGKTVKELYDGFGITKARKKMDQKARDRISREPEDPEERRKFYAKEFADEFVEVAKRLHPYIDVLEAALTSDQLKCVETIIEWFVTEMKIGKYS